jgi:hypothetical protein
MGWHAPEGPEGIRRINLDPPTHEMGFFRQTGRRRLCGSAGHLIRDTQLERMQMQGHDASCAVTRTTGMGDSPEPAPHQHVPDSADLGTRVDIPQHKE